MSDKYQPRRQLFKDLEGALKSKLITAYLTAAITGDSPEEQARLDDSQGKLGEILFDIILGETAQAVAAAAESAAAAAAQAQQKLPGGLFDQLCLLLPKVQDDDRMLVQQDLEYLFGKIMEEKGLTAYFKDYHEIVNGINEHSNINLDMSTYFYFNYCRPRFLENQLDIINKKDFDLDGDFIRGVSSLCGRLRSNEFLSISNEYVDALKKAQLQAKYQAVLLQAAAEAKKVEAETEKAKKVEAAVKSAAEKAEAAVKAAVDLAQKLEAAVYAAETAVDAAETAVYAAVDAAETAEATAAETAEATAAETAEATAVVAAVKAVVAEVKAAAVKAAPAEIAETAVDAAETAVVAAAAVKAAVAEAAGKVEEAAAANNELVRALKESKSAEVEAAAVEAAAAAAAAAAAVKVAAAAVKVAAAATAKKAAAVLAADDAISNLARTGSVGISAQRPCNKKQAVKESYKKILELIIKTLQNSNENSLDMYETHQKLDSLINQPKTYVGKCMARASAVSAVFNSKSPPDSYYHCLSLAFNNGDKAAMNKVLNGFPELKKRFSPTAPPSSIDRKRKFRPFG